MAQSIAGGLAGLAITLEHKIKNILRREDLSWFSLVSDNLLPQIGIRLEFKGVEHGPLSISHFLCHSTPVDGRLSDSFRRHYSIFLFNRKQETRKTKPAETREFSRLVQEDGGCTHTVRSETATGRVALLSKKNHLFQVLIKQKLFSNAKKIRWNAV